MILLVLFCFECFIFLFIYFFLSVELTIKLKKNWDFFNQRCLTWFFIFQNFMFNLISSAGLDGHWIFLSEQ